MVLSKGALAGIRVLEVVDETASWCGKLFADMGAEVIRIEPPGGVAERKRAPFLEGIEGADRSLAFLNNNTNKKSLSLELASAAGAQTFRQLARTSELVIESLPVGQLAAWQLDYHRLRIDNPALVMTSITGFGQTGPHCHFRSADIVAAAMGGAMAVTGAAQDPPVVLAGSQSYIASSTLAAVSSMIALHHSAVSGCGQHVDISMQEAMLMVGSICGVGKWLEDGMVPARFGTGLFASVPSGAYACSDGSIYLMINRPRHWQALARWVNEMTGNREILDPMFEGPSSKRQPYREMLDLFIGELSAAYTVADFYREGQRRHLAVAPVNTGHSIVGDGHLQQRQFFVELQHGGHSLRYPGPPYRMSASPWRIAAGAPTIDEHKPALEQLLQRVRVPRSKASQGRRPAPRERALAGLRVVEFTTGMAGPWIGRIMACCGAEVIKVESRDYPDVTRLYVPPRNPELGVQSQLSPWLTDWNAGKRFVGLDLNQPAGLELAKQLVAASDVVIDNNANGVLDKLGLGFAELQRENPALILLSSTGYGRHGPDSNYISWGPNIEALSGLSHWSGFDHRHCTMTQFAYPDPLSALYGLFAILCALQQRNQTGSGQCIELSQLEVMLASLGEPLMNVMAHGREPEKLGNSSLNYAPHGCYPCAGIDRWCVIVAADQQQWRAVCEVLQRSEWLTDSRFVELASRLRYRDTLDELIASATHSWCDYDLMQALQRRGVAAGVVQNAADQYQRDPQLAARHYFETLAHARKGEVVAPGIALGLTVTEVKSGEAGRGPGADNKAVFCGLLGISPARYRQLRAAGVIH